MKFKFFKENFWFIIVLSVFLLLFLSYNNNFYTDNSYNVLKFSEQFKNYNSFNYYDHSFNNIIVEKPFFYETIIGFFNKFFSFKIIHLFLLLFFSSSLYLVYLISFKISESKTSAIVSLLLYSSSIIFYFSVFSFDSFLLSVPLILLFFYFIITKQFDFKKIFFLSLLLSLLDFKSFFLIYVLSFSYFIFLSKSEKINNRISELNFILILSTIFFVSLVFRENLQFLGLKVLYPNLPLKLFFEIINPKNIVFRLYSSSIIVLLLGVFGVMVSYSKKVEKSYIVISSFFVSLILLFLTNNFFYIFFLGVSSSILSSFSINYFLQFVNLSKFKNYNGVIYFSFIFFLLFFNILQSFYDFEHYKAQFYVDTDKLEVYNMILKYNSSFGFEDDYNSFFRVFSPLEDSFKTEYFSGKDSFVTYEFNYVDTPNLFYNYYNIILNSKSNVEVISLLKKYNVRFLIFYNKPFYLNDNVIEKDCFKKIYENNNNNNNNNNIFLYEFKC